MKKYEYNVKINSSIGLKKLLNDMAKENWEPFMISGFTVIFRREVPGVKKERIL